jgi:hypothetical protein
MSPFPQLLIQKTKKPKTWKVDIFYSLYSIVIQVFTPPYNYYCIPCRVSNAYTAGLSNQCLPKQN